jgi:lysophospholipase L1-like esterase
MKQAFRAALVSMLLLVGLVLAPVGSVGASPPQLVPGLPAYLALGDSIANGEQSAPVFADYWQTVDGWRANGYVAQFDAYLVDNLDCLPARSTQAKDGCRQLQLVNLSRSAVPAMDGQPAMPGVTSQLLIDEQLPAAVQLLQARNHDANPRNDVEMVTLTVGGNDVFEVLATCQATPSSCGSAISAVFTKFGANLSQILHKLRQAAGPGTPIITMTYYNSLLNCPLGSPTTIAFADWILEGGTLPGLGTLPVGFNDLIRNLSAAYGAEVAETFGLLSGSDLVGDCRHPNKAGHTKIAGAFEAAFSG